MWHIHDSGTTVMYVPHQIFHVVFEEEVIWR